MLAAVVFSGDAGYRSASLENSGAGGLLAVAICQVQARIGEIGSAGSDYDGIPAGVNWLGLHASDVWHEYGMYY